MLKTIRFLALFFAAFTTSFAYAADTTKPAEPQKAKPETISFYQQPDIKSPVITTIKSNQPIIFIFNQNDWSKIADPSNGNVGWVKNETLKQAGIPYINTVTQAINNPDSTGFKVIQSMGSFSTENQKLVPERIKQWQAQQAEIQKMSNQIFEQNVKAINQIMKQLQDNDPQKLMIVPVDQPVVSEVKPTTEKPAPAKMSADEVSKNK